MSVSSKIEWTDATWNPVRGCSKVSSGCKNCYAETFSERFRGVKGHPFEQGFDLKLIPEKLNEPLRWKKSKLIFVNSMSDLFHPEVPDSYIYDVFNVMRECNHHVFQVLTKRPERLRELFYSKLKPFSNLAHIWMGVSVENKEHGLPRIKILQNSNVCVRFLSIEPLLEHLGLLNLDKIDWVIVGGESGRRVREMKKSWVLDIQKHCFNNNVPFFFKQWGGTNKKKTGREIDGKTYDNMPVIFSG